MFHPRKIFRRIGPGVITGASDDDPSGIITYSQAGAQFGYGLLWLAVFTTPLMMAVQEMSGRLGLVTGRGLAYLLRRHVAPAVALIISLLVLVVNTLNVGADLGAMAEVTTLLWPGPASWNLLGFAAIILGLEIWLTYRRYVNILKWLTLSLLTYVAAALAVTTDWTAIFQQALIPHWPPVTAWGLIVAVLGTTLSPYLFFWQASEEVEEEREEQRRAHRTVPITPPRLSAMRRDTVWGMVFSNVVMFFIIVTAAGTLHQAGLTTLESARQAAEALRPVAGPLTFTLFALGIIGTGLLAVPILAGSAAYAVAEVFGWPEGLSKHVRQAPAFYLVIVVAIVFGLVANAVGLSPVRLLLLTAVMNGLLAPVILFFLLRLADRPSVVGEHRSPRWVQVGGWSAFAVLVIAAIVLISQW
ncbi:MAG: divalent metal cation transporter [Candidatus Kerfeldbacteria bacterium]|nr:divalent metal cation transporter [Candidatus Kerfeldbacteria bacterium]